METESYPFRHWIIDNWCTPSVLYAASLEFPDLNWHHWYKYEGSDGLKFVTKDSLRIPPMCSQILMSMSSIDIKSITGQTGLFPDVLYHGGGMHVIPPGGFLARHLDSNKHPISEWGRCYSAILYLSKDWDSAWGGELEFWDGESIVKKVECIFNRLVIFECTPNSFHSVSSITKEAKNRKSLACFFWNTFPTGSRERSEFS